MAPDSVDILTNAFILMASLNGTQQLNLFHYKLSQAHTTGRAFNRAQKV